MIRHAFDRGIRAMPCCVIAAMLLGACGTAPTRVDSTRDAREPAGVATPGGASIARPAPAKTPAPPARSGGYYLDDGPGDQPPSDLDKLQDPQPKHEPLHRFANNPYSVFGQEYVPERQLRAFTQRGLASWYGHRFHGSKTANGEVYDMYQLSAAHPTLPIPSYVRVTNVTNRRQVIVRVNDRGPFLRGRIIDLSYAAATKLGYVEQGSTMVEVASITPAEIDSLAASGTPAPVGGPERMVEVRGAKRSFPLFAEREGVFVQLGAFAMAENAESLRARLTLELSAIIRSTQVVLRNGLHRIWVGPYRTQQEARVAAERLAGELR